MAKRPRVWERLKESTRKRYVTRGRSLGQTETQVKTHYLTGGSMSVYRGHPTRPGGVSESMWTRLRAAAKKSRLDRGLGDGTTISDVLESVLRKGFSPEWILSKLDEQRDSRDTYLSAHARYLRRSFPTLDAGYQPGRRRFHNRNLVADIELFYYH